MNVHLDIVTPERAVFSEEISHVLIPGWGGEFGVLAGHDLFLSLLRGGVLTVNPGAEQRRFVIGRGFVEVGADRVTVLTNSCTPAEKPNAAEAMAEVERLSKQLSTLAFDAPEADAIQEQLEVAKALLSL